MGRGAGYEPTAGRLLELTTGDANADFVACEADSGDGQKGEKGASPRKIKKHELSQGQATFDKAFLDKP